MIWRGVEVSFFLIAVLVIMALALRPLRRQSQDDAFRMSKDWIERDQRRQRDGRP